MILIHIKHFLHYQDQEIIIIVLFIKVLKCRDIMLEAQDGSMPLVAYACTLHMKIALH